MEALVKSSSGLLSGDDPSGSNDFGREENGRASAQVNNGQAPIGIMIADDDEVLVDLYSKMLKDGYKIIASFHNGLDLVSYVQANVAEIFQDYFVVVIVLDYQMPVMDGREAARRLRSFISTDRIKIVLATARPMIEDQESKRLFDYVLTKPFSVKKLLEAIESSVITKIAT